LVIFSELLQGIIQMIEYNILMFFVIYPSKTPARRWPQ